MSMYLAYYDGSNVSYLFKRGQPIQKKHDGLDLHLTTNAVPMTTVSLNDPIPNGGCDGCFKWESNKTFIKPPRTFCYSKTNGSIDLLIMYTSAPKMTKQRKVLRQIYTRDLDPDTRERILLLFAFGKSLNKMENDIIADESESYGDIIQFDVPDTYYSMHLRYFNVLKWVHSDCIKVRLTVKMVDDARLNIPGVLTVLDKYGTTQL